jgi:predicted nuclease of predicted toxin-antitoxin system
VRFLADASCDFSVVRALRAKGHDVRSVHEEQPTLTDEEVSAWAADEGRVLITEDKDFGYLVHVSAARSAGVVLLRFPASLRKAMPAQVCAAIDRIGGRLGAAFAVIQPGRVRLRRGVSGD